MLLLAAAGLSRLDVVALDADAIRLTEQGATIAVPERAGVAARTLALARRPDPGLCPVRALEDWLSLSDTRYGPVFRKVDRWGSVEHRRLGADAVRLILARHSGRRAARAGIVS
jgi:hypothetical protein